VGRGREKLPLTRLDFIPLIFGSSFQTVLRPVPFNCCSVADNSGQQAIYSSLILAKIPSLYLPIIFNKSQIISAPAIIGMPNIGTICNIDGNAGRFSISKKKYLVYGARYTK